MIDEVEFTDVADVMLATGAHWETYFGPDKESYHVASEVGDLKQVVDLHAFSVASLAGSLLQHAKQGLSLVHGALAARASDRTRVRRGRRPRPRHVV
jgi:hypothetical protein